MYMCIVYIMTRMQVYLPDEVYEELRLASRLSRKPMSGFVRKGLDHVLGLTKNKKVDRFKSFVGKGKTKVRTDAVNDVADYYRKKV